MRARTFRICALLLAAGACGAAGEKPLLLAGVTRKALYTYTPEEVKAVTKPFVNLVGERVGRTARLEYFKETRDAVREALRGRVQFIFSDATDVVRLEKKHKIRLVAIGCAEGVDEPATRVTRACIAVHADSGLRQFEDLRGKTLVVAENGETIPYLYLDKLLGEMGILERDKFFASIIGCKDVNTALDMILARRADVACVADTDLTCKAMHDGRVKKGQIVSIRKSPEAYPPLTAFCLEGRVDEELIRAVQKELINIHKSDEGNQMVVFFKIGGFALVRSEEYDGVRELVADVDELRKPARPK